MNEHGPSRHSNPFATCWTRPGALPFQFAAGESAEQLVERLAAANWRGEIVGPHGSGKSTLLESIKPHLARAGRNVSTITLRDGQRRLPRGWLHGALLPPRALAIVDGYEQLSRLSRKVLLLRCRRARAGVLVTSHVSSGLPTLVRTQPDLRLAYRVVSTLTARIPSRIAAADIDASHACHGSNMRELLFALYERHETLARTA